MDFMDLRLSLWLISKTLNIYIYTHKTQKRRREIHSFNSVDGRFEKAWMVGLTKHSNMDFTNYERRRIIGNGGENWLE